MAQKEIRLVEIKDLYDQLIVGDKLLEANEDEKGIFYAQNQSLSEQILSIVEELLREDPLNVEALFWKISIHNGPYYDDVSVILSTAQEIIDNLPNDKEAVLSAYDLIAWSYEHKLELKEKAIEVLHDKLIEISKLKDNYSLQDKEFGNTYYKIAFLYRELEDFSTAEAFYRMSFEHTPDHYYTGFQGGNLSLERGNYGDAFIYMNSFYNFHSNAYCGVFGKALEVDYQAGKIDEEWGLLYLMYAIAIDYPEECGYKNVREVGIKYASLIEKGLKENPDNAFALQMKAKYYMNVEKNTKRAFEYLHQYFDQNKKIEGPLYFVFYELGERLGIDVQEYGYELDCEGVFAYNLMTLFLEKGGEYRDNDDIEKALVYYHNARNIGKYAIQLADAYFETGVGNKVNNNKHGYALMCNNLGIVCKNIVQLTDGNYAIADCVEALQLHRKGYEIAPFWENMESGLRLAELMKEYDEVAYFANELLTYYDVYSATYMAIKGRILKNYLNAGKFEEAKAYFKAIRVDFELKEIEDEDVVAEVIYMAADLFTYLRYELKDYHSSIDMTEAFFSKSKYVELNEEVANINYWFSLAWAYHGLEDFEKAAKYFDLMRLNYKDNERYKGTIEDIPAEYSLPKEEREALNRLWVFNRQEIDSITNYPLEDTFGNVVHLNKIVDYITGGHPIKVEGWLNDDVNLKVFPRVQRKDVKEEIFDTSLDFYFQKENITIRFTIDERNEQIKSFFGLRSKNVWKKEMFVYYYFYKEGETTSNDFDVFGNGHIELDKKAQLFWNAFVSKYYQLAV